MTGVGTGAATGSLNASASVTALGMPYTVSAPVVSFATASYELARISEVNLLWNFFNNDGPTSVYYFVPAASVSAYPNVAPFSTQFYGPASDGVPGHYSKVSSSAGATFARLRIQESPAAALQEWTRGTAAATASGNPVAATGFTDDEFGLAVSFPSNPNLTGDVLFTAPPNSPVVASLPYLATDSGGKSIYSLSQTQDLSPSWYKVATASLQFNVTNAAGAPVSGLPLGAFSVRVSFSGPYNVNAHDPVAVSEPASGTYVLQEVVETTPYSTNPLTFHVRVRNPDQATTATFYRR